jgi:hypothetical protein
MRTITMLMTAALLFLSGCPDGDTTHDAGADLRVPDDLRGSLPLCDPRAEASHGLKCNYGVDTLCRSQVGAYDCRCECDGYWECDQVKVVCDPDAGTPHD